MAIDRRRLIREYKQTPRVMGVGAVRNTTNGRLLLMVGVDIRSLLNRHQAQLRLGVHRNRELQADWLEHGEAAFEFQVLDTLQPSNEPGHDPAADLQTLEALWLEKLSPFPPTGYNPRPRIRQDGRRAPTPGESPRG
jgi:hypothetical protein